jgi:prepilin-type N-terminal cleavage/methylation domain-containing protein
LGFAGNQGDSGTRFVSDGGILLHAFGKRPAATPITMSLAIETKREVMAISRDRHPRQRGAAFTLVELLIVIAIVGVLIALLLPAVQTARESGRRTQCSANLRQISTALLVYHDRFNEFPSGGWGHQWIGIPSRGFGKAQPGGWIYSLLPFIEQANLHEQSMEASLGGKNGLLAHSIAIFTCPSRRGSQLWPVSDKYPYMFSLKPAGVASFVGRGDYAINGGASSAQNFRGPDSLEEGDGPLYSWPSPSGIPKQPSTWFTGISHIRMSARITNILDGCSATYLVGEKYLDPMDYETGQSLGDNESLFNGFCSDNHRYTELNLPPALDGSISTDDLRSHYRFGSAHPTGACFAFCDGSIHFLSFDIDAESHYRNGHIADEGANIP